MKDSLGDRMKHQYENRTRYFLPRRTYTVIRIDGKAFHTYTKGLERPFDMDLINDMDHTAIFLCENVQGVQCGFVQSDEISLILSDFGDIKTQAWFDGNLQKMASISSSYATGKFNRLRPTKLAFFDSRVYTIPDQEEVLNYILWRQQDTTRNSISSVAQSLYSHKELHGKSLNEMQEMCFKKGVNWNDYNESLKRGRLIVKEQYQKDDAMRSRWISTSAPIVTQNRDYYKDLITVR